MCNSTPHDRHEDLGSAYLPGEPVEYRHGIAREVHEQLFSGRVGLTHGRRDLVAPFDIEVAEAAVAVAVAVGMMAAIFNHPNFTQSRPKLRRPSFGCCRALASVL